MSLLGRLLDQPKASANSSLDLLREIYGPVAGQGGTVVNVDQALTLSTVWICVRIIAETLAQIPLVIFEAKPDGAVRAESHPLYQVLHEQPNGWQTSFEFRETLAAHLLLRGNAYAIITMVRGAVRELIPVPPEWVIVRQDPTTLQITYTVTFPNGHQQDVPPDRMLHIPGLSWNGRQGLSVISYMREVLGVTAMQQTFAAKLYANGAQLRGVLEHPKSITKDAQQRLKDQFDAQYTGVGNSFKTMLLEEGMKYNATSMTAHDAEFLASRKFQRAEIAGWYRVPLHMCGDLDRSTNNNIEQQSLEFVMYTMMPWVTRWEQRLALTLLSEADRKRFYIKFVVQGLLRGDFKTRVEGYGQAIRDGWMNRNEARQLEDLNRVNGLDQFILPINYGEAGAVLTRPLTAPPSSSTTPPPTALADLPFHRNGNGTHHA